jgi:hypothetical protein
MCISNPKTCGNHLAGVPQSAVGVVLLQTNVSQANQGGKIARLVAQCFHERLLCLPSLLLPDVDLSQIVIDDGNIRRILEQVLEFGGSFAQAKSAQITSSLEQAKVGIFMVFGTLLNPLVCLLPTS